jgi:hypothetical protein
VIIADHCTRLEQPGVMFGKRNKPLERVHRFKGQTKHFLDALPGASSVFLGNTFIFADIDVSLCS